MKMKIKKTNQMGKKENKGKDQKNLGRKKLKI